MCTRFSRYTYSWIYLYILGFILKFMCTRFFWKSKSMVNQCTYQWLKLSRQSLRDIYGIWRYHMDISWISYLSLTWSRFQPRRGRHRWRPPSLKIGRFFHRISWNIPWKLPSWQCQLLVWHNRICHQFSSFLIFATRYIQYLTRYRSLILNNILFFSSARAVLVN